MSPVLYIPFIAYVDTESIIGTIPSICNAFEEESEPDDPGAGNIRTARLPD